MSYQPIENYGIIGNMQTSALIGKNGSLDWFCFPHFDSPSIFGALLDSEKGGSFAIEPQLSKITHKQVYWPDTNVLVTRFLSEEGVAEITDFMPVGVASHKYGYRHLVRRVQVIKGHMAFLMKCEPAFNYGRDTHKTELTDGGAIFYSPLQNLGLGTRVPLKITDKGVISEFELQEGESAIFSLQQVDDGKLICLSPENVSYLFDKTVNYWHKWLSKCTYSGRWREMVYRSALVLKLLTYEPTGAIIAAATTSLPEGIGGERNWDYRYTWIRDAAFTIYALMRIGFTEEAANFMNWLEGRCRELEEDGSLQIMYGIDGRHDLPEEVLDHLEGYQKSAPVRIGNNASKQLQLDIYGALLDAVYLFNKYGSPISYDLWRHLRKLTNWVVKNWNQPDEGIWEVRGGKQHFVDSRVMCWVALDRAIRLADKRSFPSDYDLWIKTRDTIYEEIMEKGWNKEMGAFTQAYGSDALDASMLIMPLVFFVSPTDPRMLKTLDAINKSPSQGGLVVNSLVYRYNTEHGIDGLSGDEGTFNICSFWLVEALTRAGSAGDKERLHQARLIFEQMLGYANHLGLYAEETGPNGEALGNFPQAYTHLALISAAFNLDRALGKGV